MLMTIRYTWAVRFMVAKRLVRIGKDAERQLAHEAEVAARTSELIDEMHVMAHAQGFRQTDPAWARHVR